MVQASLREHARPTTSGPSLGLDTEVALSEDQVSCNLGGETAVLSLSKGCYYGLDPVGSSIWNLLAQKPRRIGELRDAILAEYDVSPDQCEADLMALIREMMTIGLVKVRGASD